MMSTFIYHWKWQILAGACQYIHYSLVVRTFIQFGMANQALNHKQGQRNL